MQTETITTTTILSMASLREELAKLANPTPVFKDPENDSDDETAARLVGHDDEHEDDILDSTPSQLRRRAATVLSDSDKKYAGKRVLRSKIEDISEDHTAETDDSDRSADDEIGNGEGSDNVLSDNDEMDIDEFHTKLDLKSQKQEFSFEDDGDYGKYADNGDDDDSDDDDSDDDDEEDDDDDSNEEGLQDRDDDENDEEIPSDDDGIRQFSSSSTDEVAKGKAANQQLGLWDVLLEGRIKLQKSVLLVNQLPQHDTWSQFSTSQPFSDEAAKTERAVKHLLDSLISLQDLLCLQNTETRYVVRGEGHGSSNQKNKASGDSDDEEIPSDTDDEDGDPEESKVTRNKGDNSRKRKRKVEDYPEFLSKRHTDFQTFRDSTIQRWNDKTRLAGGKVKAKSFNAFEQSVNTQINRILSDKERLIRRTQLKRSVYRVLGTTPKQDDPEILPEDTTDEKILDHDHLKDYDMEIFDDSDFYHQLLRELIEKKTADMSDPVALSRQWLEIQKLRGKNKKKVDKKASKGRKVRYNVHKKLVNFMAAKDDCQWSSEARDDLFKSLFGKRFSTNVA